MSLELPVLYAKNAKKNIIIWQVSTENDLVVMANGLHGGKLKVTKTRAKPTNLGRSNQRLGPTQAVFEAKAAWQKKIDEGYFESLEAAANTMVYLPMLAYPILKRTRNSKGETVEKRRPIFLPCHVQRKLNGLRCLASKNRLMSRQGTEWVIPHIREHVDMMLGHDADMLDGEVYCHGVPLQELNSLIKVNRMESLCLTYNLYDMPSVAGEEDLTWERRWNQLAYQYTNVYLPKCKEFGVTPIIRLVETILMHTEDEIRALEKIVMAEGYEGLILRKMDGKYLFNVRTDNLIKWKLFQDAEFKVVDAHSRTMIEKGREFEIIDKWVCENNINDKRFEVVPMGTIPQKEKAWTDREGSIGQRLIVRFLERSTDGIPVGNPVGVAFRLEEDTTDEKDMWKDD